MAKRISVTERLKSSVVSINLCSTETDNREKVRQCLQSVFGPIEKVEL